MRINRRKWTEDDYGKDNNSTNNALCDLLDLEIVYTLRITYDEYDYIADKISDKDMSILFKEKLSFPEKRQFITILDKYLDEYRNRK